ncbi:gag-pol polyprotein [Cucumis melo var. makuwa]|uniref:Gag-pol polyprotein n=1 Tax=Cucumis melo var. makuwa TaxID=1194695 RepID=A0A5D3CYK9_CUCMM|nr:gag-pol polyprotein [Cucumis melo var. makuwa]
MKITAIEDANDVSKMKLDELFGSLRTFELHLRECDNKRKTGIALTASVKKEVMVEPKVSTNEESWHMMGNALFFSELKECSTGLVMFGNGGKGRINGKGTIDQLGLSYLLHVRLVNGLLANLISTNQICDQGYFVSFSEDKCNVMDSQNKTEKANMWHKRLGHISGATISKNINVGAILGQPTLTFDA